MLYVVLQLEKPRLLEIMWFRVPVLSKAGGWVGWVSDSVLEVIHFPSGGSDCPLTVSKLFNFAVSSFFFLRKNSHLCKK